ncbi:hypothetical protein PUN28_001395 [Cardiocondyla obscurior]|uniref:Uncharacterized protein n=1 Tax=Cardiocondyla obscurior TaxID=286306 RepID=A0AAW2H5F4_9HYME
MKPCKTKIFNSVDVTRNARRTKKKYLEGASVDTGCITLFFFFFFFFFILFNLFARD